LIVTFAEAIEAMNCNLTPRVVSANSETPATYMIGDHRYYAFPISTIDTPFVFKFHFIPVANQANSDVLEATADRYDDTLRVTATHRDW